MTKDGGLRSQFKTVQSVAFSLRRHWVFIVILSCGSALRAAVTMAYQPALFYSDSFDYLLHAYHLPLSLWHPPGYSVFLRIILLTGTLAAVPVVQHLMILGGSILLYAAMIRNGVRTQLAGLACAPLILDAYQLQIEQYILSEALFEVFLIGIIAILLWRTHLTAGSVVLAGILLGAAALVRLEAVALVLPVAGFLVVRQVGWIRAATLLAISVIPLLGMASLRSAENEGFSITGGMAGIWLYGRVAPFADCSIAPIPYPEQRFCPTQPLGKRPGTSWFENSRHSPARLIRAGQPASSGELSDFARHIIAAQPLDYVRAVADGFVSQFRLTRSQVAGGPSVEPWIFATSARARDQVTPNPGLVVAYYGGPGPRMNVGLARLLHSYQKFAYVPGPVMAVFLLIALAGIYRPARTSHRQMAVALLAGLGVIVVLTPTATAEFTWRYVLPTLVLFPSAAVLSAELGIIPGRSVKRVKVRAGLLFRGAGHTGDTMADPGTPADPRAQERSTPS